jgi:hypothetical protein
LQRQHSAPTGHIASIAFTFVVATIKSQLVDSYIDPNQTRISVLAAGRFPPPWTKENIMKRTVCAFAVATFICAVTYGTSRAAPIAPLTGIQTGHLIQVYSHHYRHSLPVIIVPPTRRYRPYWWPQGQYHWSPYGPERWGYWCEGAGAHRLSC